MYQAEMIVVIGAATIPIYIIYKYVKMALASENQKQTLTSQLLANYKILTLHFNTCL